MWAKVQARVFGDAETQSEKFYVGFWILFVSGLVTLFFRYGGEGQPLPFHKTVALFLAFLAYVSLTWRTLFDSAKNQDTPFSTIKGTFTFSLFLTIGYLIAGFVLSWVDGFPIAPDAVRPPPFPSAAWFSWFMADFYWIVVLFLIIFDFGLLAELFAQVSVKVAHALEGFAVFVFRIVAAAFLSVINPRFWLPTDWPYFLNAAAILGAVVGVFFYFQITINPFVHALLYKMGAPISLRWVGEITTVYLIALVTEKAYTRGSNTPALFALLLFTFLWVWVLSTTKGGVQFFTFLFLWPFMWAWGWFWALPHAQAKVRQARREREQNTSGIYGRGRVATDEDLKRTGLLGDDPKNPQGIPLGFSDEKEQFLSYRENQHIVTVGPSRSGKLATALGPVLLSYDAPLFVIDPKGEAAAISARYRRDVLGHEVFIINPFGSLESHFSERGFTSSGFNPLAALDPASPSYVADVEHLAEAIVIPEGKDPHWPDSARALVSGLIFWLVKTRGKAANLAELRDIITLGEVELAVFVKQVSEESPEPYIKNKLGRFAKSTKEIGNIISTATTQTEFLDIPALRDSLSADNVRFINLKRRKMTVYVILPANLLSAKALRWFRLLVGSALDTLTATPEKNKKSVLMVLDEFPILGHMSSIENALGITAGFGVQLWPIVQDIFQLKSLYGERWQSFLTSAGIQQYFTPNEMETAEFISKRAGNKTVVTRTYSEKRDLSFEDAESGDIYEQGTLGETGRPVLLPQEIMALSKEYGILFKNGFEYPIIYRRPRYFENPYLKSRADKNPFHE